jgi:hypothetical protein
MCFTRRNTLFHQRKHSVSSRETLCFFKRNTLFHKWKQIGNTSANLGKRLYKSRKSCCLVVLLTCCPLKSAFAALRTLREIYLISKRKRKTKPFVSQSKSEIYLTICEKNQIKIKIFLFNKKNTISLPTNLETNLK